MKGPTQEGYGLVQPGQIHSAVGLLYDATPRQFDKYVKATGAKEQHAIVVRDGEAEVRFATEADFIAALDRAGVAWQVKP